MPSSTILLSKGYSRLFFGWLTLSIFAVTGVLVALAERNLLPREALVAGFPAVIATMLFDTFLFNEFLIRTGEGIWVLLYTFLYIQAIIAAAVITWFSQAWNKRGPSTSPN
ncbi:hypothetical protein [Halosimplex sp. J119]